MLNKKELKIFRNKTKRTRKHGLSQKHKVNFRNAHF